MAPTIKLPIEIFRFTPIEFCEILLIQSYRLQIKSTKIHLVQTDGVSDSKLEKPFPDFRTFNIEELTDIKILEDLESFETFIEKYNPLWEGYKETLEKV